MKNYMHWVSVFVLFFQYLTKCSEHKDASSKITSNIGEASSTVKGRLIRKKKRKYPDYFNIRAHNREMSIELEELLSEKEKVLNIKTEFEWEDIHKYPLEKHITFWNNFCARLWPGIPGHIEPQYIHITQTICQANLFPIWGSNVRGRTLFKGFQHDYNPIVHKNVRPFAGDFICCDCKYVQGDRRRTPAVPGSHTYFFAMKIADREYFLLTKVENVEVKINAKIRDLLKIVDYVCLPESTDIDLNN